MTIPKIVGFTGPAGSGKDEAASTLQTALEALGKRVVLTSFAHPIREIARKVGLDPYNRERKEVEVSIRYSHFELCLIEAVVSELGDVVGEESLSDLYATFVTVLRDSGYLVTKRQDILTISPRRFCQLLGTEGGRAVRQSFWNDVLVARVKRFGSQSHPLSQRRWPPAADIVLVTDVRFPDETLPVDTLIAIDRPGVAPVAGHDSESHYGTLFNKADYKLVNDGTLAEFQEAVAKLAEDFQ